MSLRWLLPAVWWYLALRALVLLGLTVGDLFTHERLLNKLTRWDGQWFLVAAREGWPRHLVVVHGQVAPNPISFFPALPLSIRWLSKLTFLPLSVSGVVISAVTGLTATLAIGMLVRAWRDEADALRAAILFAVFPGTFVFSLIYAEGMVLTLTALGLLALLRKRWLLAGVLGAAATFTSPVALAFVVACTWGAVLAIHRDRGWRALLAPLLAPLGFVFYMFWLWRHTGVFNAWRIVERDGWKSYPSLRYPLHVLDVFFSNPYAAYKTIDVLIVGMAFTGIGLYWVFKQRQPSPVIAYAVAAVILLLISRPVGLRPRFVMVAFPVVIAWALRFEGSRFVVLRNLSVLAFGGMAALEFYSWAVFP